MTPSRSKPAGQQPAGDNGTAHNQSQHSTFIDPLISSPETARALGISPATLRKWRWAKRGPVYVRIGDGPNGRVMYAPAAIREWIEARTVGGAT